MTTANCIRCREDKEVSNFTKNKNMKNGLNSYCKLCLKIMKVALNAKEVKVVKKHDQVCEYCNTDFISTSKNTRFCHKRCQDKQWQKNKGILKPKLDDEIVETTDGYEMRTYNGMKLKTLSYFNKDRVLHRDGGAAMIHYSKGEVHREYYFLNGKGQEKPNYKPTFNTDGMRKS